MTSDVARVRTKPEQSKGWAAVNGLNQSKSQDVANMATPLQTFRWQLAADATVGLALVAATQRLTSARVDTPKLDSEVMLGHVLGWSRAQLYAHPEQLLTEEERTRFERLVVRRFQQEPVAYLVGEKAFYGLDFYVDQRVLIPRPETELLVDMILDVVLQYDEERGGQAATLADIGTGSGAISVAVAANTASTRVYAVDISPDALSVAISNAQRHNLMDRIQFLQGSLLNPLPQPVDIIAANLPYVAAYEWEDLSPGITDYEPTQALLGGADGLDFIRNLLLQAPHYLKPSGVIMLEVGASQGGAVAEAARVAFPHALIEVLTDYAFRERIVRIQT